MRGYSVIGLKMDVRGLNSSVSVSDSRASKKEMPLRLFAAAFAISVLTVAISAMVSWELNSRLVDLETRQLQISEYVSQVKLFDEVLTMSARMAAVTGDSSYRQRYDRYDRELEALLIRTKGAVGLQDLRQFLEKTDAANLELVKIERRALALAAEGQQTEASALLAGNEYSRLKRVYADGLKSVVVRQRRRVETERRYLNLLTITFESLSGISIFVLLMTWHFAFRAAKRWGWERLRSEVRLHEARDNLELRVRERTAKIAHMARHDFLTGLVNRGAFVEGMQQKFAMAHRTGVHFAIFCLDLDHFKDINDTFGHPVGDRLLQLVGQRLQATTRGTDEVARFGGDEFALIANDIADPADAAMLADKILKAISDPFTIQGKELRSGVSIGIAVYGPDAPDAETLLSHADFALYRAKTEGRGTHRFFTKEMDVEIRARIELVSEFRVALATGQLVLMYQPEIETDTGQIVGVEALVRWQHPNRGLLLPDQFIPAAQKGGLIVALTQWVLREACREMREWREADIAPPVIAVNVSAVQFSRPLELERDIAAILIENALPAKCLELALTEDVLMIASREHNDALLRLRGSGMRLAIDDFGRGFSSLNYLSVFPVDRVKSWPGFMFNLTTNSISAKVVRVAINLAHEFQFDFIAEGVDTVDQLKLLRAWDCHKMQGGYFSGPLFAPEMASFLRARLNAAPSSVTASAG